MIIQTPGVYIKEKSVLPGSIGGVSTAIPAFIGITEKQQPNNKPTRIKSMFEFHNLFGGAYHPDFSVTVNASVGPNVAYSVPNNGVVPDRRFFLYDALSLYFTNGGGPCYIVSAGTFDNVTNANLAGNLSAEVAIAGGIDEVTLMLMPDMHFQYDNTGSLDSLASPDYSLLASGLITESAYRQDRFSLLDYRNMNATETEIRVWLTAASGDLPYGAVYYPWLRNTSGYQVSFDQLSGITSTSTEKTNVDTINTDLSTLDTEFGQVYDLASLRAAYTDKSSQNPTKGNLASLFKFLFDLVGKLDASISINDNQLENYRTSLLSNASFTENVKRLAWFRNELTAAAVTPASGDLIGSTPVVSAWSDTWVNAAFGPTYTTYASLIADSGNLSYPTPAGANNAERIEAVISDLNQGQYVDLNAIFAAIAGLFDTALSRKKLLEDQLFTNDPQYALARTAVEDYMKQSPAQGAVAGIYCKNDRERGVWKSPANMAVQGIERPLVEVSNQEQDSLNHDVDTGKAINVIRTFTGKGPLVWGARTLDANSNEWRYIAVRRFFNFAEESIKKAMNDFVFEPNNARTWVKIKAMVVSFLAEQWKSGALVGNKMDEAFFVRIGEDTTSETEILQGKINIQIGMAVARPAEFVILEFSHYTKA